MMVVNKEMFTFSSVLLPEKKFYVAQFEGTEGLNSLFNFKLVLLCKDADIDTEALVGSRASFTIHRPTEEDAVFPGYISQIFQRGSISGYSYYAMTLEPSFAKLKLMVSSAVFLDCDLKQTIEKVMTQDSFLGLDYEFRLAGKYPTKEFGLQYKENSFEYILYRLEEQGAYFYFDKSGERVIFADNPMSHEKSAGTVYYSPYTGLENSVIDEVITSFTLNQAMLPKRVIVQNYDWKDPNTMLVGKAEVSQDGTGEVYLSNEETESRSEAERIAKIRAEQILSGGRIFKGSSHIPFLRPGVVFTLTKHHTEKFNRDYLVTKIKHEGKQETLLNLVLGIPIDFKEEHLFYRNSFECIESDVKYVPSRTACRTVIPGSIRAFIDGDKAGEALMDKYGRYKVLFAFDVSGRSDGKATAWIRRAQEQVGKDFGIAFPLVAGTEVLINFLRGNPDLPVITGALANGESGSISGGGNSHLSGIRTSGGPQVTFNNKNNGILLTNATGSGIAMASGSMDYMSSQSHIGLKTASSGASNCAGFLSDNMTGFAYRRRAICSSVSQYLSVATMALANTGQKIYDSLSPSAADPLQSKVDFGAMATKLIALIPFLESQPYNTRIAASRKNASVRMQCFPSSAELLVNILLMVGSRLVSLGTDVADSVAAYKNLPSDEVTADITQYTERLKESMQAIYDAGVVVEYEKYNGNASTTIQVGEYFEAADKSPCTYYEKVKKALEDSIRTIRAGLDEAPSEENREAWTELLARLEKLSPELDSLYTKSCEEPEKLKKEHAYNANVKKNMLRNKIVGQVVSLIPEIAVIVAMYVWRNALKTKKIGGIMISAKDKNMNLHAKTYIGFHADRGIYFNTKKAGYGEDKNDENGDISDWGSPCIVPNVGRADPKIDEIFIDLYRTFPEYEIKDYIKDGHGNARKGDVGTGPTASSKNNRFIALYTDIYLMNNASSFQTTTTGWNAFSPEYLIKTGDDTYFHLKADNEGTSGDAEISCDASIEFNCNLAHMLLSEHTAHMQMIKEINGQQTDILEFKSWLDSVGINYKVQGEQSRINLSKKSIVLSVGNIKNPSGYVYFEEGYATLGGKEIEIGGVKFKKEEITGAKQGILKFGDALKLTEIEEIKDNDNENSDEKVLANDSDFDEEIEKLIKEAEEAKKLEVINTGVVSVENIDDVD